MKITLPTLLILAIFLCGCGAGNTPDEKVTTTPGGATVQGKGIDASIGTEAKVSESDLHVPFYPGAKLLNDKCMKVKTDKEESVLAYFESTDDPKVVAEFYQSKVAGLKLNEFKNGDAVNYMGDVKLSDGAKVAVTLSKKSADKPVEISVGYGKTSE